MWGQRVSELVGLSSCIIEQRRSFIKRAGRRFLFKLKERAFQPLGAEIGGQSAECMGCVAHVFGFTIRNARCHSTQPHGRVFGEELNQFGEQLTVACAEDVQVSSTRECAFSKMGTEVTANSIAIDVLAFSAEDGRTGVPVTIDAAPIANPIDRTSLRFGVALDCAPADVDQIPDVVTIRTRLQPIVFE